MLIMTWVIIYVAPPHPHPHGVPDPFVETNSQSVQQNRPFGFKKGNVHTGTVKGEVVVGHSLGDGSASMIDIDNDNKGNT
jgi:hypothetical protein